MSQQKGMSFKKFRQRFQTNVGGRAVINCADAGVEMRVRTIRYGTTSA